MYIHTLLHQSWFNLIESACSKMDRSFLRHIRISSKGRTQTANTAGEPPGPTPSRLSTSGWNLILELLNCKSFNESNWVLHLNLSATKYLFLAYNEDSPSKGAIMKLKNQVGVIRIPPSKAGIFRRGAIQTSSVVSQLVYLPSA